MWTHTDILSHCGSVPPKPPPFVLPFTTTHRSGSKSRKIFRAPLPRNDIQMDRIEGRGLQGGGCGEGGVTSVKHEAQV